MTALAQPYPPHADPATRPLEGCRPRTMPRRPGEVLLGIFLPNQSWSFWPSTAATSTEWTYEYNKRVVAIAERIGISFVLPAARWKGIRGDTIDWRGASLDTVTLAGGLLESTDRITVLSTLHTNVFHPVVAAKLCADLDQISGGRFGLNIVSGWNADEFASMNIPLLDRKERYRYTTEWLEIVRELWANGSCTYQGKFFTINDAVCRPRPVQSPAPVVVNAGQSYTGMSFTAREADYLFSRSDNAVKFRNISREIGRDVGFIGTRKIILRERQEAAERLAEEIFAQRDMGAVRGMMISSGAATPEQADERLAELVNVRRAVLEDSIIGTPDLIATELAEWAATTELDGICLTLYDYEADLTLFGEEVIPRLAEQLSSRGMTLRLC